MSTPATVFAIYVFIGLICLVVALATRGKESRTPADWPMAGTDFDAAFLLFISLLWPLWLLKRLLQDDKREK